MRITLALFLAALAVPASAADRNYSVTSFDRIRVEGPYAVSVTTNVSPFARASGSLAAMDGVSLRVEGRTLYVRAERSAWGGKPDQPAGPVTLKVGTTYRLRMINITTARPGLAVSLFRDSSVATWRVVARDGAELDEPQRVTGPARTGLTIGQTVDVEITPREHGTLRLEPRAAAGPSLGALILNVSP